jgi:hypothetical protein
MYRKGTDRAIRRASASAGNKKMTDTVMNPIDDELSRAIHNSARHAVSNNICKNDLGAKISALFDQAFEEAAHMERKRVLDTTRQNDPLGLCRMRSSESDQHGRCYRCGSGVGEPCGDNRIDLRP